MHCRSSSSLELGGITGPSSPSSDTPARYRRKSVAATRSMVEALTVFIQQTYPLALLQWLGKLVVVVLFVLYIVLSSWGVSRLRESFQLESVIPAESYYTKHLRVSRRDSRFHHLLDCTSSQLIESSSSWLDERSMLTVSNILTRYSHAVKPSLERLSSVGE